jgi:D-alanine-D-alanine ligase
VVTERHVLVLAGGLTHEREVSLRSGARISDSLRRQGHDVTVRDVDSGLIDWLSQSRPDAAVLALHGGRGENGAVQGVLTMSGVAHVGTSSANCRLAWDKPTAKLLIERAGLTTPHSITLTREAFRELGAASVLRTISAELPIPVVVKPTQGGSAQGVTIVEDEADLPKAMVHAYTYCDAALVEQKITGTEIAVGIIDTGDGPVALPAVEIEPVSGTYGFEARYNAGETNFYTPARITAEAAERAAELALGAHRALGLRHISRIDIIVDGAGTPWFLEASTMPGLTETSLLPQALEAAGHDLGWVYMTLAEAARAGSA